MTPRTVFDRTLAMYLAAATLASVGLFGVGALRNQSLDYWYLPYNLLLGIIPLLLAMWLVWLLQTRSWKNWLPVIVTILWLLFLPNSFYIVTDFIHLPEHHRVDIVQDTVMLMQFSLLGLVFGFISLFMVHKELLLRRVNEKTAHLAAAAVLLLSSFAIYLGRDLRWNSWDIAWQPLGLFIDIFERILSPTMYPAMWSITLSFFVMLVTMYLIIYHVMKAKRSHQ